LKTKKVLIIDDDQQILDILKNFVKLNDCSVDVESTAEKGLAMVRTGEFDIVILDIMLPDLDGIEVLKRIQRISPNLPVIMITGGNNDERAKECLKSGAVDFIAKPFDFEYLRTSMLVNILAL